jgi:hypothetical protein
MAPLLQTTEAASKSRNKHDAGDLVAGVVIPARSS